MEAWPMLFPTRSVGSLMALSVVVALAGCDDGKPKAERDRASSAPVPGTPTPSNNVPEAAALTAYRGLWNAFVQAGKTSDPDAADLRTYASGQALTLVVSSLYTD